MDKFIIEGGRELYGNVKAQSAKNSVLVLLAASVLTEERVIIENVPKITDVYRMNEILAELGANVTFQGGDLTVESEYAEERDISPRLTKELRSSVFMLGAVLTRFRHACISYPGGCDIGLRPIDLHLSGLRKMGVEIEEKGGYIVCNAQNIKGGNIHLDFPSVGATENIILAAAKAPGETYIFNAAKEPEIVDLQNFLNAMGGDVRGAGSDIVRICGVKKLHGVRYRPIGDRIEGGTFLIATALCGGEVCLEGIKRRNISSLLEKLSENTCKIHTENDKIYLSSKGRLRSNRHIETMPFPGFPTDLQAQMTALNATADGACLLTENLFETRFRHVPQLMRMGADIVVKDRTALIRGVNRLHGALVSAEDLRGGAALVLAALGAEGQSEVVNLFHIDRGYASFEEKLTALGASVRREKDG
jgi:UDP-N-acetylglucosamine 1-carboxyvinyltransferase